MKPCIDCKAGWTETEYGHRIRPAPNPGPRCATHWRAEKRRRKAASHEKYLERTYRMPPGMYARLLEFQGGVCYMCRRATGASKKLAVDHDHACCPETPTCGKCTRGLLCSVDNKFLGHGRDDPMFFLRGHLYLINPPARRLDT